ncbi:activity-dependent neuroprotector homeobox protein 2 isoform X2 [Pseudophryne corroboree]|uniref:activity-dependent neuroprotector homeobox protein 2 isoform X2 n=1 Tax=Pseudophryne corroboree TaxID=495146 RepID=UPI0030820F3D
MGADVTSYLYTRPPFSGGERVGGRFVGDGRGADTAPRPARPPTRTAKMFQPPVNNLDKIRKARKRVKQLLLQIGLETCRDEFEGYRSKQYCCSLCKFSTKLLSSFKGHLQRYHEDEKDQELMSACPSCPFTSQTKNVIKHMRIFHSSVRKVPSSTVKESPNMVNTIRFSCVKCAFTDTLYYSMKRHVLMSHHHSELESYFGEKSEEEIKSAAALKIIHDNRYFCRKCHCVTSTPDALIYHILTADKHRDLEQKLRTDISDMSRSNIRRPYKRMLAAAAPSLKQQVLSNSTPVAPPPTQEVQVVSIPQNGPNQPLLGASNALVPNIVTSIASVSDPTGSLLNNTSTTVATTTQVGFVTSSLSQNQSFTLQASLPQSVFLTPRFSLNQPITATVFPPGCNVGGQIIRGAQTSVRPTVLPMNQTLSGGLLPMTQSTTVLTCSQPLQSNVINLNQPMQSTVFPVNQQLKSNNLTIGQPGISQNTFLTAPIFRQLIPTGKQVNGIPTYTLVTLPVAPCAIPAVNPPKVPIQLSQPNKVVQVSTSPASAPSPPVVTQAKTTPQQTQNLTLTLSQCPIAAPGVLGKEAKQWKTCPVCNELFPSNVYEVHMQIAHIKSETGPSKQIATSASNETKEAVVIAAQASYLKVLKGKSIRCVTCKMCPQEEEVLKHLLMHGMICLYCKAVFHELRNFVYHMKILHVSKKIVHPDFVKKGITISRDAKGDVHFPHFDLAMCVSREELGDKDMHLAVVAGANANTATTIYIKIQPSAESSSTAETQSKCRFCNYVLSKSEVYETHLKERHHIMPTVHTILKTPAFKCIHCCGVYTGSMTLSAIAVHLQRCRNAPKDSTSGVECTPENSAVPKGQTRVGTHDYAKTKLGFTADSQVTSNETKTGDQSPMPSKRRRIDCKPDHSEVPVTEASLEMLALIPGASATESQESKKAFLFEYFHKRPYPSKKEIELLSTVLEMWKSDVASFFGTRRYICMKFLRSHKQQVILGFKMDELKKVKHDVELQEDY